MQGTKRLLKIIDVIGESIIIKIKIEKDNALRGFEIIVWKWTENEQVIGLLFGVFQYLESFPFTYGYKGKTTQIGYHFGLLGFC